MSTMIYCYKGPAIIVEPLCREVNEIGLLAATVEQI